MEIQPRATDTGARVCSIARSRMNRKQAAAPARVRTASPPRAGPVSSNKRILYTPWEVLVYLLPEFRLALFLQRLNPLAMIRRPGRHGFVRDAGVHDGRRNTFELEIDEHLRPPNGVSRAVEKTLAERIHGAVEFGGG